MKTNLYLSCRQKSASTRSLSETGLPNALKSQLLVKSTVQDKEIMERRRNLAASKSVGELSRIGGLSDFPVPGAIERLLSKSKTDVSADKG